MVETKFKKGQAPWNKGLKGYRKDHIVTDETKRKISLKNKGKISNNKGKPMSEEQKNKISIALKGKRKSDEARKHMSISKKGCVAHNKGKITPLETRIKQSLIQTKEIEFNGFKNGFNRRFRNSSRLKIWRKSVFERDNYTCQDCGLKRGHIEAHHKITFANCIKNKNIKLTFDINNGITLCKKCHRKKHTKGGKNRCKKM